jgi:hypothetical protein
VTDVQDVKNKITQIMATAHDFSNELGGRENDRRALNLCEDLIDKAAGAKDRYSAQAFLLRFNARVAVVLSTVLAVANIVCRNENSTNESPPLCESFEGTFGQKEYVNAFAIILPILAAALLSLESTFRPRAKYANLLLAEHKLESEKFKFRARVGVYNSFGKAKSRNKNARKIFMEECKLIFAECTNAEFKDGVLEAHWFILSRIKKFFRCTRSKPPRPNNRARAQRRTSEIRLDNSGNIIIKNPFRRFLENCKRRLKKNDNQNLTDWEQKQIELRTEANERELAPESCYVRTSYSKFNDDERKTLNRLRDLEDDIRSKRKLAVHRVRYRVLSIDDYILERLVPKMQDFKERLPVVTFFRNLLRGTVILLTAATTFFFAINHDVYVPIIFALSAAAEAFYVFFQLETATPHLQVAYSELRAVLLETAGPSTLESRLLSKKTAIVERTEAAILSYYEHMSNATLRAERKGPDEDTLEKQRAEMVELFSKKSM